MSIKTIRNENDLEGLVRDQPVVIKGCAGLFLERIKDGQYIRVVGPVTDNTERNIQKKTYKVGEEKAIHIIDADEPIEKGTEEYKKYTWLLDEYFG